MSKKRNIKHIFNLLYMITGMYFLIIACNAILRPLYLDGMNRDINLTFVVTTTHSENALADNVRINRIAVNGQEINLGNVDVEEDSLWQYDSKDDFLYVYDAYKPQQLSIQLEDVHTLSVGMVQEVGAGIVEIWIDGDLWKTVDLYKNTEWDTAYFRYDTGVLVFPERNIVLQLFVLGVLTVVCLLRNMRKPFSQNTFEKFTWITWLGIFSILVNIGVSLIQYGKLALIPKYILAEPQSFLKSTVFIFLLLQMLAWFTNRFWISFLAVAATFNLAAIVSNVKLLNRDVPLLPWDFTMTKEAASVAVNYQLPISVTYVILMLLLVVVTIVLAQKFSRIKTTVGARIVLGIILIIIMGFFVQTSFIRTDIESNNAKYRVYQVDNYYMERGFVSAFLEYCVYLNASEAPEGYSKDNMEKIVEKINCIPMDKGTETPTIIAVMSESFWDIERVNTLDFKEEILPNYRALQEESAYGEIFTHVFNGGTVVSEFEFLTGFSGEFFPNDYMVYGNFLDEGFASAVNNLESLGYKTTALHPYVASNYNRESAYQKLGFDESFFEDSLDVPRTVRNYVSDSDLFQKVIAQYEKKKEFNNPQFIFSVTMQNHGGYWGDTIYTDGLVEYATDIYSEVARESIDDYVAGLHESDRALGELIDYFRSVDEKVIVIYFGDHVSDAGPKDDRLLEETSWYKNQTEYDYETHRVPFIVWSNYDDTNRNIGIMEVGELFPTVFEMFDIRTNRFWNYLQKAKNTYGATDSEILVDNNGGYVDISYMTDEQRTYYETYKLLQYDYIWGERYAAELWNIQE